MCSSDLISHGTAALEYDLAKEINGEAAATEIHRQDVYKRQELKRVEAYTRRIEDATAKKVEIDRKSVV